ncbi:lactose regulatory protein LAC9 [Mariannaea sp. PMI_226]|nr:lactose regulatory protein LAC9 [Mariannaea sp. PMI_226]
MDVPSSQLPGLSCDSCRTKKLKCSREYPKCSACVEKGRACCYSSRTIRSPLTRAYLSSIERRLQRMEALIARLHPGMDIEKALASTVIPSTKNSQSKDSNFAGYIIGSSKSPNDPISERVPDEADGFDWHENVDDLADGMAALSVNPKGAGYLGSTAGVFFLRSLLYWRGQLKDIAAAPDAVNISLRPTNDRIEASSRLSLSTVTRQVMERLIDGYFSIYHRTYPFVHEATFRAQFHEVIPRPHQPSYQMLLHTILALGAWCLDDTQADLDDELYHNALSFVEGDCLFESANLTSVQGLVLLSNLSQKRNKPNTGSNFLGLAIRMALSLGLHRELPDWEINLLQREMRRRVWWGLYIFDSGASTTFGRPILLPGPESMDIRPVLNIADETLTANTTTLPKELNIPTLYSGLKAQSDLHLHSNHMSNTLLSSTGISPQGALSMNQALDAWSETLPVFFHHNHELPISDSAILFAKSRLWWRFWNLKIILFRQFLLKRAVDQARHTGPVLAVSDLDARCRDAAVNAASSTITSIAQYLETAPVDRLVSWYSIFFIFHASLVIALAVLGNAESTDVSRWQADLDSVRRILLNTFSNNSLAKRCAGVLDLVVAQSHTTNSNDWTGVEMDLSWMDFSTWPSTTGDFFDYLRWPESGGSL